MNDPETNRRFDRIEIKIDKLTEVMSNVARVEEQIVGVNGRLKRHEYRLDENEKKIEEVSETVATNSQVVKVGQAIAASIWAGFIGVFMYMFKDQ